jgi:HEAT repeat protein
MTFKDRIGQSRPDIDNLIRTGNIPALIRLMGHADPTIRWKAARFLGESGPDHVSHVIDALSVPDAYIRLGALEALGAIKDKRAVRPVLDLLHSEKKIEVSWAAIIALGELGSPEAIPDLEHCLISDNRYIRYGAACALHNLGWKPTTDTDQIYYLIALQDWKSVRGFGPAAIKPLSVIYRHTDPDTRSTIVSLLGELGDAGAHTTCQMGLKDRDPHVRWTAVLASMNCGIRSIDLPPFVADRERTGPNPAAAALLNFLFLGIGYNYIGKWWGFPVFMAYMSILVLAQLYAGPFLPYLVAYPVTAVLGIHTYYLATRMSDL